MTQRLEIGLLGCGQATTKYHIPAIKALKGYELSWVCDTDEDKAKKTGKANNITWYTDPSKAIETTPDLININTPPFTHRDLAIDSLEAGANILLEKPAAMSVNEVDEIIEKTRESEQKACMVHNNLFFDPMLPVLQSIKDGEFGELLSVHSFLGGNPSTDVRDWSNQSHGGEIGDRLPHPIYLVTHFIENTSHRNIDVKKTGKEVEGVSIQIEGENVFGHIEARQTAIPAKQVEIIGSKKRATVDLYNYTRVEYNSKDRSPITMLTDNVGASYQILRNTASNGIEFLSDKFTSGNKFKAPGHYHLLKLYRRSILNDDEPPIPLDEGRKVVSILDELDSDQ